ncbi:MAG: ferredoxin [Solirubrobacteraceae bacterium]|jgi:ferredoxin-like protein FixX|nr:ferredoxin [Solirubrobacteraceae bacterium]
MRTDGIFIGIEVQDDAIAADPLLARHLAQVCPVDIYREPAGGGLEIVAENVDECVLCRLCLDIATLDVEDGSVRVLKLYDDGDAL